MDTINFSTTRGDTWNGLTINISQSGTPVDITGAEFNMQVRKNSCASVSLSWSTSDETITLSDPENGQLQFESRKIDITPTTYGFDCEMILDGNTNTIFNGVWTVTEDYTR